ncbi:hypothetical protein M595_0937 [Lyngbya aestuarii BL J]|uniref:Uncharacterized protein n=1 Tax=Lyngbya aestuarii BL J TaxID=1348334 RepID=U7QMF7_9CYAN|nr:hypothetical protein M595_0937 [Lyngbya aestuarii BL J]
MQLKPTTAAKIDRLGDQPNQIRDYHNRCRVTDDSVPSGLL